MKGSLVVVAFFCAGCMIGAVNNFQYDMHSVSMYVLYALMLQVGISIGSNKKLKELIKSLRLKMLLVPIATITGTLLFSALASLLLSQWSVFDCMAVGSGFAYYSLSSILITQFKEPSIGLQLATELGTIALLANIFREMMALLGAPLIRKYFVLSSRILVSSYRTCAYSVEESSVVSDSCACDSAAAAIFCCEAIIETGLATVNTAKITAIAACMVLNFLFIYLFLYSGFLILTNLFYHFLTNKQ